MRCDRRKQRQQLTSTKKERRIQECELAAARKKADIAMAKLEQAKAEQEAARVEAEAIAAREEAKRVLEELKNVKTEVQQMTASNKKKAERLRRTKTASAAVENKSSFNTQDEFTLRLRDNPTLVSELTGQLDEYMLDVDREWQDGSENTHEL